MSVLNTKFVKASTPETFTIHIGGKYAGIYNYVSGLFIIRRFDYSTRNVLFTKESQTDNEILNLFSIIHSLPIC